MKKLLIGILLLIIFLIILFLVRKKVGNIMPVILPPKNVETPATIGEKSSLPFSLPSGFTIGVFAKGLKGARDLEFTTDGTLLISQTSEGKIVALAETKDFGIADKIKTVTTSLNKPHGLAFHDEKLYVAEENAVSSFDWDEKNWELTNKKLLFSLPSGGQHYTRSLIFDKNGKLYISIGSTCDVCVEKNPMNGSILISDENGKTNSIFAKGLRNSVFIALNQKSGEVWATEMGRDWLGDETPPDEINIVKENGDYGWPYCYGDKIFDKNFGQKTADFCNQTISPIYNIPAHSAPLGLAFINSKQFPDSWQGDLLVAYHGSWNRSTSTGYKVVHMKVQGNKILSEEDFLTGFLSGNQALARPVDLVFDREGSLYISDDKAGYIFKIVSSNEKP